MRNKIKKVIYLSLLIAVLVVEFSPVLVFAQMSDGPTPTSPPTGFELICKKSDGIAGCVAKIYLFSLGAGAVIALLMVILAGYRYMTAGGNATQVSEAKDSFELALKGLIIIFVGFVLLYLINPDLVQFQDINSSLPQVEFDPEGEWIPPK